MARAPMVPTTIRTTLLLLVAAPTSDPRASGSVNAPVRGAERTV